jgi:glycosyltransferase involved in cell wall biosynthesis
MTGRFPHVVATVRVYNEADIVDQVLGHLFEQRINFVVLDGGSQDGSVEIALSYKGRGLLEHRIVVRDFLNLREDLECLIDMARKYSPDWILHNDADEFLEPSGVGRTIREAIGREDDRGFNIIQFDNFEFCLTEKDYESKERDVRRRLRFYTWSDDYRYKAWKYYPGATHRDSGGHFPIFPRGVGSRVSPRKFVMRHYRFRSPEGAMHKVFREKLPRYSPEERSRGWHVHYDHFIADPQFFITDSKLLSEYTENLEWDRAKKLEWYPTCRFPSRQELFGPKYVRALRHILQIV